jgi:predicted nuclease of restriction endonuclease-like (RecB) superfamily
MPVVFRGAADGGKRFWEFCTVNNRNKNTRKAYFVAVAQFSAWCDANGLRDLVDIEPVHIGAYIEVLGRTHPDPEFVQQAVAQLPWGHNGRILDAVKNPAEREWYIRQAVQNGWSRNVLLHQVESGLHKRQGQALTNLSQTLPAPQSELAHQLLKDPYNFDFLTLGPELAERDLERGLIEHVLDFILELGKGFALVGSQYHLDVGGQDFYLDLLFYHVRLHCYVVIDRKIEDFKPEFAGKMNFLFVGRGRPAPPCRRQTEHRLCRKLKPRSCLVTPFQL